MRKGVGIIVLNKNNEVFVGKRKDNPVDKWQMPQGGIDYNETPMDAMKRELAEETSITRIKIIKEIEDRTRVAGGEIVKLFGNGSAFYAPAASAIEMAEAYLKDKKRVIPCASLCEGEFGIDGYFIGVPSVIGSGGVEKILEFDLMQTEKDELENTLNAVKKTVSETGL